MTKIEKTSEQLFQQYSKFINHLKLKSLRMNESKTSVLKDFKPPAPIKFKTDFSFSPLETPKNCFLVNAYYTLTGKKKDEKRIGIKIEANIQLIYENPIPMTDAIFEIFVKHALTLHTWPYFREFVQSTTARMGLPSLTLDIIHTGL